MMEGIWWWGWVIGSEWRTYGEKVQVALLDWSFCKDQDLEEAEEFVRGQSEGRVDQEERIDCVQARGMSICLCESQVATVGRWEESSSTAFPGHKQGWEVEQLAHELAPNGIPCMQGEDLTSVPSHLVHSQSL